MRQIHEPRGWTVRCVNNQTIPQWVTQRPLPPKLYAFTPTQRADWLRLALLYEHGGVWLDSSVLVFDDIGHCFDAQGVDMDGFGIPASRPEQGDLDPRGALFSSPPQKKHHAVGMQENWGMASAAGNRFVGEWLLEWEGALMEGPARYCNRLLKADRQNGTRIIHPLLPRFLPYMAAFASWCVARTVRYPEARFRLRSSDRFGGPYELHRRCAWNVPRIVRVLANRRASDVRRVCPWMVKIRGGERFLLERAIQLGMYHRDSCLVVYLGLPVPCMRLSLTTKALIVVLLVGLLVLCGRAYRQRQQLQ